MTGASPSPGSTRHLVLAVMAVVVTIAGTVGFQEIYPLSPDGLWTGEWASRGCKRFYPLVPFPLTDKANLIRHHFYPGAGVVCPHVDAE
jgi:hypothetical protein